jgi:hypothetical protein
MSRRRLAVFFAVICATLVFPRQARAGLADIIWEMSGPQMVGGIVRCRVPFDGGNVRCQLDLSVAALASNREWVWLALEGGVYVSTGLNNHGIDYEAGHIGMIAFEPMLEFSYGRGVDMVNANRRGSDVGAVYFGAGPMINHFLVRGSPPFVKYGIKLRPIAITFSGWTISYNLRLYPDGFTPDEFTSLTPAKIGRPFEAVQSVSVSIPWLRWNCGR